MASVQNGKKSSSQVARERFKEFDEAVIGNGELIYSTKGGPYNVHFFPTHGHAFFGNETREFQLIRFGSDVTMLRGVHKIEGVTGARVSGFPECRHETWRESSEWKEYILFKNGDSLDVVSDAKEILEAVKKATGIDLPKLSTKISEADEGDDARYPHEIIRKELKSDEDNPVYSRIDEGPFWEDSAVVIATYKHYLKNFPGRLKEMCLESKRLLRN
jgi:hypothetical protein